MPNEGEPMNITRKNLVLSIVDAVAELSGGCSEPKIDASSTKE